MSELVDALPAPKGNLLSYGGFERDADEVAGRLPAAVRDPHPFDVGVWESCSKSMPESFHGLLR